MDESYAATQTVKHSYGLPLPSNAPILVASHIYRVYEEKAQGLSVIQFSILMHKCVLLFSTIPL